jgi:BirA family biotin operon repressor/biotin-[acetyl-CoA-carboxylase] ligase
MKWKIVFKDEALSSMDAGFEITHNFEEGLVFFVKKQNSGRGRQGRLWVSPLGGLYCSLFFKPDWLVQDISKMTLLAAVAISEAVDEQTGADVKIKWPNDLLIDGKKVAGILTESKIFGQTVEHVIVGIGVNVNTAMLDLPEGAVSLKHLTGREYDLRKILDDILARFDFWYEDSRQNGFESMLVRWRELCGIFGWEVRIHQEKGVLEGVAIDIAEDGGLVIQKSDGSMVKVMSGDVTRVRKC